jgi:hypothetical protein
MAERLTSALSFLSHLRSAILYLPAAILFNTHCLVPESFPLITDLLLYQ